MERLSERRRSHGFGNFSSAFLDKLSDGCGWCPSNPNHLPTAGKIRRNWVAERPAACEKS